MFLEVLFTVLGYGNSLKSKKNTECSRNYFDERYVDCGSLRRRDRHKGPHALPHSGTHLRTHIFKLSVQARATSGGVAHTPSRLLLLLLDTLIKSIASTVATYNTIHTVTHN